MPPLGANDRVCLVVPRRNVETWIWYFDNHPVDEITDYKGTYVSGKYDFQPAKRAFAQYIVDGIAPLEPAPPALLEARADLLRVPHK